MTDRLGTAVTGYPYGTDIGNAAGNDQPDFATYTKDATTGFEYANQRYYSAGLGRFLTADSYGGSVRPQNPETWNRYAYSSSDPVNSEDPTGSDDGPCGLCFILNPFGDVFDLGQGGGGGAGQIQPTKNLPADPPSAFPECNPNGNPTTERKLNFIYNNYDGASSEATNVQGEVGKAINVSGLTTTFLQWSANESGYGLNPADVAENNFFGVQNPGNASGLYGGATVGCNRNGSPIATNSTNACFSSSVSWGQELGIALGITSSKTNVTYLTALETALESGANMAQALQAIANNGWNPSSTYGSRLTSQTRIQPQIDCLRKNGYI